MTTATQNSDVHTMTNRIVIRNYLVFLHRFKVVNLTILKINAKTGINLY